MSSRFIREQRGAAMVFGLFFALFLVAAVWSILGVTQALLYRDQLQDAADAAAFSAAVVNARGMNLMVLLNMLMAALLAILVGIRLAQALCVAAILICGVFAWPTAGASLQYVPTLTSASNQLAQAFDRLKEPIHKALSVLRVAGKATSVAVPLGSNLRVIDLVAARYQATGFAVPARLALPLEEERFDVLCARAGALAGYVGMAPLAPILPNRLEDAVASGLSALTQAGSDWFCGKSSEGPDVRSTQSAPAFELFPKLPSQQRCEEATAAPLGSPHSQGLKELCDLAAYEALAALPGRNGLLREGERVCPTDCQGSDRPSCPPGLLACDEERAAELDELARRHHPKGEALISDSADHPFSRSQRLAAEQCKPEKLGGRSGLRGFAWQQLTWTRTYHWQPDRQRWLSDETLSQAGPLQLIRNDTDDASYPCGPGGHVDQRYDLSSDGAFLCEGLPRCESDGVGAGPCDRSPPGRTRPPRFRESTTRVVRLMACARQLDSPSGTKLAPIDLEQELQSGEGEAKLNPFRLEQGLQLGGSDFQLRAIVFSHRSPPDTGRGMVFLAVPRAKRNAPVAELAEQVSRLGLAQAEYYFDGAPLAGAADRSEWMWNMGWRARLRPFRVLHSKADAPRGNDERGLDPEQMEFAGQQLDPPPFEPDCAGQLGCEAARSLFSELASWEEEP